MKSKALQVVVLAFTALALCACSAFRQDGQAAREWPHPTEPIEIDIVEDQPAYERSLPGSVDEGQYVPVAYHAMQNTPHRHVVAEQWRTVGEPVTASLPFGSTLYGVWRDSGYADAAFFPNRNDFYTEFLELNPSVENPNRIEAGRAYLFPALPPGRAIVAVPQTARVEMVLTESRTNDRAVDLQKEVDRLNGELATALVENASLFERLQALGELSAARAATIEARDARIVELEGQLATATVAQSRNARWTRYFLLVALVALAVLVALALLLRHKGGHEASSPSLEALEQVRTLKEELRLAEQGLFHFEIPDELEYTGDPLQGVLHLPMDPALSREHHQKVWRCADAGTPVKFEKLKGHFLRCRECQDLTGLYPRATASSPMRTGEEPAGLRAV